MKISEYKGLTSDSRKVVSGGIFVAVRGYAADGHGYIGAALDKGASCIVYDDPEALARLAGDNGADAFKAAHSGVEFIQVENSRKALAELADEYFDHPSRDLKLVGITGTNGKTTTVTLLYNLFTRMGYKCGLLSTIANYVAGVKSEAVNTTSDPVTINSLMRQMVDAGCGYCFMEVSSIGAEQDRVHALDFNVGIFSNLTHDHLDYHKTFAEYIRCKKLFFDALGPKASAVINIDDRNGMIMTQNTRAKVVTYSCRRMADHSCKILEETFEGMLLKIDGTELWCPLIGQHNAYNALAIYSAAIALGADREEVLVGLSNIGQVCGRLEQLKGPRGVNVVIDYAHTPDAMENVLKTLREIAPKRQLTCVFGCGGDRDRTKRPEMGEVAARLADRVVITSDNSRSENTADIISDIKTGIEPSQMRKVICIEDRAEAIRTAIITAEDNATIALCGKGHEDYQITGSEKRHFDEHEVVKGIFNELN